MMNVIDWLLVISPPILAIGCLWIGIIIGKGSRKVPLIGKGFEEALAWFLIHEIGRHEKDIASARIDLNKLRKRGVRIPMDIPYDTWLEVE